MSNVHYTVYDQQTGVIKYCASVPPTMVPESTEEGCSIWLGYSDAYRHYINLCNKTLAEYTDEELEQRDSAKDGLIWAMPERKLINQQTKEQALVSTQNARRAAYPPLEDFADAMYWASRGNPALLDAYFAACDVVKNQYPKPA